MDKKKLYSIRTHTGWVGTSAQVRVEGLGLDVVNQTLYLLPGVQGSFKLTVSRSASADACDFRADELPTTPFPSPIPLRARRNPTSPFPNRGRHGPPRQIPRIPPKVRTLARAPFTSHVAPSCATTELTAVDFVPRTKLHRKWQESPRTGR